jgi:hypothetical protein
VSFSEETMTPEQQSLLRVDEDTKNLFVVEVYVESGCDVNDGEYSVWIDCIVHGQIDAHDYDLVWDCIADSPEIDLQALPEDSGTLFILEETGEWEDVHWHKYYKVRGRLSL